MSKICVALDGSVNADIAFMTALKNLDKEIDELFLVAVAQVLPYDFAGHNQIVLKAHKDLLDKYSKRANENGVARVTSVLCHGVHVGSMIAVMCQKKDIDLLVIGRRGMSSAWRLLAGSTSTYLVEQVECNVLVVKGNFLAEQHDSLAEVRESEENERRRRILEQQGGGESIHISWSETKELEEQERARRVGVDAPSGIQKANHELNKYITIMAEEEERRRRMHEGKRPSVLYEFMKEHITKTNGVKTYEFHNF